MTKIKIDYFSDTNIQPTFEMKKAMMQAKVGNEAAGEDPTVNLLIEKVCKLLGKDAAIFLPTGTMANAIAFKAHCNRPGDLIILDKTSHPLKVQSSPIGGLVNASPYLIKGERGIFTKEQIEPIIMRTPGRNLSRPRLVSLEQTTNFGGGALWDLKKIQEICSLCKNNKVRTHLDGARIFNASIAANIPVNEYCKHFDSVYIDFAKGLGAPIGAILAGSKEFIEEAWYYKFQLGGAMHQSGILAAACIFALENNVEKLKYDHEKAKMLAEGLNEIPQIKIQPKLFETNIIYFELTETKKHTTASFVEALYKRGIRMLNIDNRIRTITHMDISYKDIQTTIKSIRDILAE